MAPYLLQWHAMQHCRAQGCTQYDLFGIAPEGSTNHPWAGVTDFKAKFGGTYVSYPPEQQIVLRPMMKKALEMKRRIVG
jgi:lipid II:glycine glycyltransferase (peptidoglycan interpeptide bridge formation enzyme)